jgi:hypothetical protein
MQSRLVEGVGGVSPQPRSMVTYADGWSDSEFQATETQMRIGGERAFVNL